MPHYDVPRGSCRWCGEAIVVDGKPNRRARWHPACLARYKLHAFPDVQRRFLEKRDGANCRQCGATKDLHVEHTIPLWKVRHLPEADRIKYFGPENQQLLCNGPECHKAKTRAEAAERAHFNRLARPKKVSGRRWQSRVIQSPGFSQTLTRTFGGEVKKRKTALPNADMVACFATLGLRADATEDQINAAFRDLARKAHPDMAGGSTDAMTRLATARDQALKTRRKAA